MKTSRKPFLSCLWLALALALATLTSAQTPPPPPAPAPDPANENAAAVPAATEPAEKARAAAEAGEVDEDKEDAKDEASEPKDKADAELRELGESDKPEPRVRRQRKEYTYGRGGDAPIGDQTVPSDIRQGELISILGSSTVDGHVTDAAVSILGDTTVNGRVDGEAVSVLGTTTVNGHVGGEAVAVLGDIILGPDAEIEGDAVAVLGRVKRAPGAKIRGEVVQVSFGDFGNFEWLDAYIEKCVKLARPLAIGDNLGWLWGIALGFLVFYMLLALIFPRGVTRCAEVLEQKPGSTVIAMILTALLFPVLTVVLVMTGIGVVLIPFLAIGLLIAGLFGKAAVLAWFGRRFAPAAGGGPLTHPVAAVFIGGLVVCALYLIPFLGFILQQFFTMLGTGMVVYVLVLASRREKVAAPVAPAVPPAASVPVVPVVPLAPVAPGVAGTFEGVPPPAPLPIAPPVMISAATLPRAGFWIRFAAALLDFLLIGVTSTMLHEMLRLRFEGPGLLFFGLAAYSAAMWKSRGTTIGGIICGLKVVRTDDRPIDWTIAIVRALSAFLSFAVAGLGFIWVAFDDEKQSWHDKVAGTTIVKVPKGVSLL
jgi:uncharacterized RDD family membrane protein YckC